MIGAPSTNLANAAEAIVDIVPTDELWYFLPQRNLVLPQKSSKKVDNGRSNGSFAELRQEHVAAVGSSAAFSKGVDS
jgi:hypothetical protein